MWGSMLARRSAVMGAVALCGVYAAGAAPALAEPFLEVSRQGSRFSVDASGVSVAAVLTALGREAGFRVQDSRPDAQRPPVDIALIDATLQQTLTKLLDRQNHLIVYREVVVEAARDGRQDAIDRIVLLGPRVEAASGPKPQRAGAGAAPASPLAGPVVAAPPQSPPPAAAPVQANGSAPGDRGAVEDPRAADPADAIDPQEMEPEPSGAFSFTPEQIEAMRTAGLAARAQGEPLVDVDGDGQPDPPDAEPYPPVGQSLIQR